MGFDETAFLTAESDKELEMRSGRVKGVILTEWEVNGGRIEKPRLGKLVDLKGEGELGAVVVVGVSAAIVESRHGGVVS